MTINSSIRRAGPYIGNGYATTFPFAFKVFADTDVLVALENSAGDEWAATLGADYTVALNQNQDGTPGGAVVTTTPLSVGLTMVILSVVPSTQPVEITNNGGFYPAVINTALDRVTILAQQAGEVASRALQFRPTEGNAGGFLPPLALRKGTVLAFREDDGSPMPGPSIAAMGTVAGSISAIDSAAANVDAINSVADNMGAVIAAVGASGTVVAAATSASNSATAAEAARASAVGAASTATAAASTATTAAGDATAHDISANDAAVQSLAHADAASGYATTASTAATTASTAASGATASATAAATQATNAATSATAAAA
ncbi:MAG TPA: hypothetical protein VGC24_04880, partial [Burkholderiaceae bacterium]